MSDMVSWQHARFIFIKLVGTMANAHPLAPRGAAAVVHCCWANAFAIGRLSGAAANMVAGVRTNKTTSCTRREMEQM